MSSNDDNTQVSTGRARGHSVWSSLRASTPQEQMPGGEPQGGHAGISFSRLSEPSRHLLNDIPGRGDVSGSRVSLLTSAIQAAGSSLLSASSLPASAPIDIKQPLAGLVRIISNKGSSTEESSSESDEEAPKFMHHTEETIRKWCTGYPPKKSFLGSGARRPAQLRFARRSTLADKPELDAMLALAKIEYEGHMYLPLTARTIHRLSPYWKGEKPIADTKLFDCIKITCEINGVHADHVVAALERIGCHCNHLLVVSGVQTSEFGSVLNREAGNITPANDWDLILGCFPHLKHLAFVHPVDEPIHLSCNTLFALHRAVAKRQTTQQLERFSYDAPPQLLTWLHQAMASHYAQNNI